MDGSDGVVDAHKLFDRMPERGVCNATNGCSYMEYVGSTPSYMAAMSNAKVTLSI